jgi:hypothetical protein
MEHPDPHRNNEKIVALMALQSQVEADALVTELKANGIEASLGGEANAAYGAAFLHADGIPILIFEGDLDAATQVARDLGLVQE